METSARTVEFLREFLPLMAVLAVGGVAGFVYVGVVAYIHIKARLILDFYRDLGRQIQRAEGLIKGGAEIPQLPRFREIHESLAEVLRNERILRKAAEKK
ncbi:MAG: hypothetical protein HYY17_07535 [Planctomycetes bacterium]|nr:hypothetical protein [Planctomycetota bacterium]